MSAEEPGALVQIPIPAGYIRTTNRKHRAHLVSNAPGQGDGGGLTTRWTPAAFGVICLIGQIRQDNADRIARENLRRERVLKMHTQFAEAKLRGEQPAEWPSVPGMAPIPEA